MNISKKTPIVLLHGWGSTMSGEKYKTLQTILERDGYKVYAPDLPGFGNNPLKKDALTFNDYCTFVYQLITKEIKAKKVILIGHSFGGRIAIRFTHEHPNLVEKLVLTGASGIPHQLPLKKRIISTVSKIIKPIFTIPPFSFFYRFSRKFVYRSLGEMDYYKAGPLQETFKNVYMVSIVDDLDKISVPTQLIWGKDDTFTPIADGALMHKKIADSQFVMIPDATHKLPYERPDIFAQTVIPFIL
jgi:pimeloyl-ACP methyl ester carboxylesterase